MSAGAVPIDINAHISDALNDFNASKSSASIGSYRSGNLGLNSNSSMGLFKGILIFAGGYLILKLLTRRK